MCEFLTPTPKGRRPGSTAQYTRSRSPRSSAVANCNRAQAFHCFPVSLAASGEVARLVQQRKLAIPRIERQRKQIMMIPGAALKLQAALIMMMSTSSNICAAHVSRIRLGQNEAAEHAMGRGPRAYAAPSKCMVSSLRPKCAKDRGGGGDGGDGGDGW